jgi:hypothetical protein
MSIEEVFTDDRVCSQGVQQPQPEDGTGEEGSKSRDASEP